MAPEAPKGETNSAESPGRAAPPSRFRLSGMPEWAVAKKKRRSHVARVVALLEEWADGLGLDADEKARWATAGWLHDALRDADHDTLREGLGPEWDDVPGKLLHGPASAARAAADGLDDEEILQAVRWHTPGHPDLGRIGRALFMADHMEPGRKHHRKRLARLRDRMPEDFHSVLRDSLADRIGTQLDKGRALRPETVAFWNRLAEEAES